MKIVFPDLIVLCAALQAGLWDISHSGEDVGCQGAQFGESAPGPIGQEPVGD